jgi:hypothetical protein
MQQHARQQDESRAETIEYIKTMLGQLRGMAEAGDCDMLAYLIEMAHVEASDILRGERPSRVVRPERDESSGLSGKTAGKVKFQ